jgi:biopolymer transport protein ExbD
MSTMIDCTFLLLAYFILTTAAARPENRLSSNLEVDRSAEAGASRDWQPQIVEALATEGGMRYRLGTQQFADKRSLTEALRPLRKEAGLFVKVQGGVTVGFAAAALQAGHDAGFTQVTYVPQ